MGDTPAAVEDPRRAQGGALAGVGAVALLVSLSLHWWGALNAWTAFEVWDLVLAVLAVLVLVAVAGRLGLGGQRPDSWLLLPALGALVIVLENLLNRPPTVQLAAGVAGVHASPELGIWLALVAGIAMLIGAAMSTGMLRTV